MNVHYPRLLCKALCSHSQDIGFYLEFLFDLTLAGGSIPQALLVLYPVQYITGSMIFERLELEEQFL